MPAWVDRMTGQDIRQQLDKLTALVTDQGREISQQLDKLTALVTDQGREISQMPIIIKENTMALRDDLTTAEGNLTTQLSTVQQGLTDLATRIQNLPTASDITQDDVDALKADGDTLAEVATALGSLAAPVEPPA